MIPAGRVLPAERQRFLPSSTHPGVNMDWIYLIAALFLAAAVWSAVTEEDSYKDKQ